MLNLLLLKYWKHMIIILVISIFSYTVYSKIYSIGFTAASTVYEKRIAKYELDLESRISNIEYSSKELVDISKKSNDTYSKDIKVLLEMARNKPLYILKDNKCSPSEDFINVYNSIIDRANK